MKSEIEQEDINCIVCQEVPSNAHTSQCCGVVICEECNDSLMVNSHKCCPSCRNTAPNFQKNMYLIKLINKFPAVCKYDCGHVSQISEMKNHYKNCASRTFVCKECSFTGKRREFVQHTFDKHEEKIISLFEENNNVKTLQYSFDPLQEVKNSKGNTCQIGLSSKFYCGKDVGHKCSTCDGKCGPNDGCNCPPCMELDLKYRNIQKGMLINAAGRIAHLINNTFYCGIKLDYGICGKNSTYCRFCQSLKGDLAYYSHLMK